MLAPQKALGELGVRQTNSEFVPLNTHVAGIK